MPAAGGRLLRIRTAQDFAAYLPHDYNTNPVWMERLRHLTRPLESAKLHAASRAFLLGIWLSDGHLSKQGNRAFHGCQLGDLALPLTEAGLLGGLPRAAPAVGASWPAERCAFIADTPARPAWL